jgi:beta-glucanase (GH16 family)
MKKLLISFVFLLFSQINFAQVDVVYKDLVWSDEFSINGAINSTNWFHQTQLPAGGNWYNNEVQHYTNQLSNSYVDLGFLNIVAKKESFTDQNVTKQYTSARLNSKFAFKYGRVDVRAKLPIEAGTWPAIWLLGKNVNEPGGYFAAAYGNSNWPACGEIDVMEHGITRSKPDNYIQSALHTPSSYGNTKDIGGMVADSDIDSNYHIYSMNWSPNEISFLLDNVIYYTYKPVIKDASTWPFDKEQYLLLNIAMGGVPGTIVSNFTQSSMVIDYVRVYQNTTPDTLPPTNFTASIGTITRNSVELLLKANDNSGTVIYTTNYGSGTNTTSFSEGVEKSVVIYGFSPTTNYTFSVSASDASGNVASNNPIVLNARTTENTNYECAGSATESSQGTFSTGYKYSFLTTGTDVKITFELLDTDKTGVVAYLWKKIPFEESQMSNVSGKIFTKTITGQTLGSTINYAVKFAFANGLSVTKYFAYVVGSSCSLGIETSSEFKQLAYPNPVKNNLYLKLLDDENRVILCDLLGRKILDEIVKSSNVLNMSTFKPGVYLLKVTNSHGVQNMKIIKK